MNIKFESFSYFQTRTQANMVLDLSRFLDFSLKFLDTDLDGKSECYYYIIYKLCCYGNNDIFACPR